MKNNLSFSIRTIVITLAVLFFIMLMGLYLMISIYSQEKLMTKEYEKYFLQTKNIAQTIFENEVNKVIASINAFNLDEETLNALRTKNKKKVDEFVSSYSNLFDLIFVKSIDNELISQMNYLIYDSSEMVNRIKKINTFQSEKWIICLDVDNERKTFIMASKGIMDPKRGEFLGLVIGGIELNSNTEMMSNIKKKSMVNTVMIMCKDTLISRISDGKNIVIPTSYDTVILDNTKKIISYRTKLHFDFNDRDLSIIFSMKDNSFATFRRNLLNGFFLLLIPVAVIFIIFTFFINRFLISPLEELKSYSYKLFNKYIKSEPPNLYVKEYNAVLDYLKQLMDKLIEKETQLSLTNEKLKELFDNIRSGVIMYEPQNDGKEFVIKTLNKAAIQMEGVKLEDVIGKNVLDIFPHIKEVGLFDLFVRVYKTGESIIYPLSQYVNNELSVYREYFIIKLSTGEIVSIYNDLTIQKQAEEKLIYAKNEAEQANMFKSQLLANMSHEIRTPMNAIIGFSEILKGTQLTSEQKEIVENLYDSSILLLNLVNDILDYSKIEAGKIELIEEEVVFSDIIKHLKAIFINYAKKKSLNLIFNIDPNIPYKIVIDRLKLMQVLNNLLSNAIKFTDKGEVVLEVLLEEKIGENNVILKFIVKDTGIGISKEKIEKIFEPFIQADNSITRKYGGSGLGLTITKHIIENMGGNIWVESELNCGSKFYFTLPVVVASWSDEFETEIVSDVDDDNNKLPRDINILVIEDNIINQKVIEKMLTNEGFTVDVASNGSEGFDMFIKNRQKYDIVFMDIQMPVMDGYTATTKIREINKDVPIIALTAASMVEDKMKALQAGMNDHLSKPIDKKKLFDAIKKYVKIRAHVKDTEEGKKEDDGIIINFKELVEVLDSEEGAFNVLKEFRGYLIEGEFRDILDKIVSKDEDAHKLVHSLKGVSGTVRAMKLFSVCKEIDLKYKSGIQVENEDIQKLNMAIRDTLNEINGILNQKSEDLVDLTPNELFRKVYSLLENSQTISNHLIKSLLESLNDRVNKVDIILFERYVESKEYEKALSIMNEWAFYFS